MKKKKSKKYYSEHSIVDLMLLDHKDIKKYCESLIASEMDKKDILKKSKIFFSRILSQISAEEKSLYKNLVIIKEFRTLAQEALVEHKLLKNSIRRMGLKLQKIKSLNDIDVVEIKVMTKFYLNHLFFEEKEVLSRLHSQADKTDLFSWGEKYYALRGEEIEKLGPYPILEDEMISWKDSIQRLSAQLLSQMDSQYIQIKH